LIEGDLNKHKLGPQFSSQVCPPSGYYGPSEDESRYEKQRPGSEYRAERAAEEDRESLDELAKVAAEATMRYLRTATRWQLLRNELQILDWDTERWFHRVERMKQRLWRIQRAREKQRLRQRVRLSPEMREWWTDMSDSVAELLERWRALSDLVLAAEIIEAAKTVTKPKLGTNARKREAIMVEILLDMAHGRRRSDYEISRKLDVSRTTVGAVRRKMDG
jgi:hypothetical protein